ncbi:flavodoxin family protein [Mobilitalea sibirica]|uniref:Flavodoxin family protein n=1 Tax=Mobilitalea sibirica TaxID=1462919 RepID=A0A8J7L0A7_9FIRM|nr:flavodoxin family protein [Mobilitalea sibirica]MBH1941943.1 flavodoxin family protein [Mobilitalea sibirica]
MKVIAINGSPKPRGNTYYALKTVCDVLNQENIQTEIITVGNMDIKGCMACGRCADGHCIFSDENFKELVEKVYEADALLLGSPVYYAGIAGTMKSFLDRLFFASRGRMRHKVGASVAIPRRSGGMNTFDQLNNYFLISEMLIAPSYYWNVIHGGAPREVLEDAEGMSVLHNLAQNITWMLKIKEYSKTSHPAPKPYPRAWTNFIR